MDALDVNWKAVAKFFKRYRALSYLLASLRSRDADVDDAVKNGCCAHLWTCHAIFTASSTSASRDLKLAIVSSYAG